MYSRDDKVCSIPCTKASRKLGDIDFTKMANISPRTK